MTSKALSAYIAGISVLGPGLADWTSTTLVLAGYGDYTPLPTVLPAPSASCLGILRAGRSAPSLT